MIAQEVLPLEEKVFQVSELTRQIRELLEGQIGNVWVEGEISNYRKSQKDHIYFTLKDAQAQINVVWFRGWRGNSEPVLRDGLQVRVFGKVTAYEKSSEYQILAELVQPSGAGLLAQRFEELKAKLKAEGLFDRPKKPLPLLPRKIGVVTSPSGAAIRDILKVLLRRFPNIHVLLIPVPVQGEGAAVQIAEAIRYASEHKAGQLDVLIVTRGGGSLEDLWCFNEEVVARAIADCRIPVISAVGHEIDFTISDFVADVRAPTPSAAAEMVVGKKEDFLERLAHYRKRLQNAFDRCWLSVKGRYQRLAESAVFREPRHLVLRYRQYLDQLEGELFSGLTGSKDRLRLRLAKARMRLWPLLNAQCVHARGRIREIRLLLLHKLVERRDRDGQRVRSLRIHLQALNPRNVLRRGYSITRTADGRVVQTVAQVQAGTILTSEVSDGVIASTVTEVRFTGANHE